MISFFLAFDYTQFNVVFRSSTLSSASLSLFYSFLWVISRRLNFISRCFGTPCSIFIGGLIRKMEHTECSRTSAHEIHTPGNHPKERIQHSEHNESLKSRTVLSVCSTSYTRLQNGGMSCIHVCFYVKCMLLLFIFNLKRNV